MVSHRVTTVTPPSWLASIMSVLPGRAVSGHCRCTHSDGNRFNTLQFHLKSLDSACAADTAKFAAPIDTERAKFAELQPNHVGLTLLLKPAKNHEMPQPHERSHVSDELQELRKRVADLEVHISRQDTDVGTVNEDLHVRKSYLERERSTSCEIIKANNAMMRSQLMAYETTMSETVGKLVEAERNLKEMKKEVMESELVRRKLHNLVQESKGNIRVFCRVRPVLPSDLGSSLDGHALKANLSFPDPLDHKEIVVSSLSKSASGNERKEVYNFRFDRVSVLLALPRTFSSY